MFFLCVVALLVIGGGLGSSYIQTMKLVVITPAMLSLPYSRNLFLFDLDDVRPNQKILYQICSYFLLVIANIFVQDPT